MPVRVAKPFRPEIDRSHPMGRSVVHAWEFPGGDGSDGATIIDVGARHPEARRPLTVADRGTGAPAYTARRHGYFLDLGLTHRAESAAVVDAFWATQSWSIEVMIELTDESTTALPALGTIWIPRSSQDLSIIEFSYNDTWYWGVRDADGNYAFPNGNGVATNGDYVHAVLTCNGTNLRFYLNGQLATNGNLNLGTSDGANSFSTSPNISAESPGNIGAGSGQQAGAGNYVNHLGFRISHLRVYDRPLSATEALRLWADPWMFVRPNLEFASLVPALFAAGGATQDVEPPLFAPTSSFFAPTIGVGAVSIAPPLFAPTSTFFAPTITPGAVDLDPPLFAPTSSFYAPVVSTGAVNLDVPLFAPSSSFYDPTIAPGAVDLDPPLFEPTSSFYAPTVSVGGTSLDVPLFAPASSFYAPTITTGPVDVVVSLFAPSSTFYAPTVGAGGTSLDVPLFAPSSTFYAPAVGVGAVVVDVPLFSSSAVFYAPTVGLSFAQALIVPLFESLATFYAPRIGGAPPAVSVLAAGALDRTSTLSPGATGRTTALDSGELGD